MELCYMDGDALDTLKRSLPQILEKYFIEKDNAWIAKIYGKNPFVKFREVPDFELAPLDLEPGEIHFRNSKILYKNLSFLTPRQAADERFWAGLCHGVFYDYVRRLLIYDKVKDSSDETKTINAIKSRFFLSGGARERIINNTLSKYWWARHIFSDEGLDILGANDFSTKIFSIGTRAFIGNKKLLNGFIKFLRHFKEKNIELNAKTHIRPAMSELNKRGGAIILDCLTEEEIAAIMIEHVEKFFAEKSSAEKTSAKKVSTEKSAAEKSAAEKTLSERIVKDGDKIYATSLAEGSIKIFKFGNKVFQKLIGKKVGHVFEWNGKQWKITVIKKA